MPTPTKDGDNNDPFSCFGSDYSDSDVDEEGGEETSMDRENIIHSPNDFKSTNVVVSNIEQGRRLMAANIARQVNASTEHLPLKSPNFKIFDDSARGRGMAVRALRSFTTGDEILREGAAMRVYCRQHASTRNEAESMFAMNVQDAFDVLPPATAQAVMDLSSCEKYHYDHPEKVEGGDGAGAGAGAGGGDGSSGMIAMQTSNKTPLGIYQTNSFRLGDETEGGLFLTISRINHSCRPNVHHIWRPDLQKMLILATRDIDAGEEICTCYGPSEFLDTPNRQAYLRDRFSFECRCEMCMEGNTLGGDDRMMEINSLQEDIALYAASGKSEAAIQAVDRCLALLKEQGIDFGALMKPILHYGYHVSVTGLHNKVMARSYLARELQAVKNSEGDGCYKAIDTKRMLDNLIVSGLR